MPWGHGAGVGGGGGAKFHMGEAGGSKSAKKIITFLNRIHPKVYFNYNCCCFPLINHSGHIDSVKSRIPAIRRRTIRRATTICQQTIRWRKIRWLKIRRQRQSAELRQSADRKSADRQSADEKFADNDSYLKNLINFLNLLIMKFNIWHTKFNHD